MFSRKDIVDRDKLFGIDLEEAGEEVSIFDIRNKLQKLVTDMQRKAGEIREGYLGSGGTPINFHSCGIIYSLNKINELFGTNYETDEDKLLRRFGVPLRKD